MNELPLTHGEFFPSAWAKISRAESHHAELREVLEAWQGRHPLESEIEIQETAAAFRVRVHEPLPPEVPCIVGDFVHNLRSALDHVVYRCVANPDDEHCQFPSWKKGADPTSFTRSQWGKTVKQAVPVHDSPQSMATRLRKELELLEPFAGGEHEFLWLLTYLDNVDKHRLVLSLSAAAQTAATTSDFAVTTDAEGWIAENAETKGHDFVEVPMDRDGSPLLGDAELHLTLRPERPFPLEDRQEVLRYSGPGWRSIREVGMQFDVVLGEPERYAGASLLDNLHVLGANTSTFVANLADALYEP